MADLEEEQTKLSAHDKQQQQWQELSKAHWNHWRAWGSWFSWGSPVGLGIFFVLCAVTFAIIKFSITL